MARTDARREAAIAWIERYYLEAMREALGREAIEVRRQAEAAQVLYRGGRGTQADVFAMRTEVARLEDRRDEQTRRIAVAKTQLARWVGADAERPLARLPALRDSGLRNDDFVERLRGHPELEVYARREEVADAEVRLARLNKQSDWTVELMYGQRGQDYADMVSLNVAIPLQWNARDRQDRELAAKLAMLDEARAVRLEAERAHTAEVRALLEVWQSGQARVARYRESIRPLTEQRTQAALAAFRSGQDSLGQLMEARRASVQTELEQLELERNTAIAWAQLRYLNLEGAQSAALSNSPIEAQQ
jgi:outer membrane protein TolC